MINKGLYTSNSEELATPQRFFDALANGMPRFRVWLRFTEGRM